MRTMGGQPRHWKKQLITPHSMTKGGGDLFGIVFIAHTERQHWKNARMERVGNKSPKFGSILIDISSSQVKFLCSPDFTPEDKWTRAMNNHRYWTKVVQSDGRKKMHKAS